MSRQRTNYLIAFKLTSLIRSSCTTLPIIIVVLWRLMMIVVATVMSTSLTPLTIAFLREIQLILQLEGRERERERMSNRKVLFVAQITHHNL